jgi:hypothetical protein
MTLQWAGPVLGAVTVATIWFGHVMVRKVNYHFGTRPVPLVLALGAGGLAASLFVTWDLLSAVLGIVGITTVFDGIELIRQEARVRRGHAPENPNRPVACN